jgi:hypothetical protein
MTLYPRKSNPSVISPPSLYEAPKSLLFRRGSESWVKMYFQTMT